MVKRNFIHYARGCEYLAADFLYSACDKFFAKRFDNHHFNKCIRAREAYVAYFGMPASDQNKLWAAQVICDYRRHTLEGWSRGRKRTTYFAISCIWLKPSGRHTACYFCKVDPKKQRKRKNICSTKYSDTIL